MTEKRKESSLQRMSGHSKWSTIKRQKGAADVRRGATFTKLSIAITLAVKQSGGIVDPNQNLRLRLAIDSAKTSNMPKETIERAITRASGREGETIQELTYEGYAPGGAAVMVETATDNTNRTSSEVKGIFNKAGASFGQPGTVSYLFETMGLITVLKNEKSFDEIFAIAVDAGASDIQDGEEVSVYTSPADLSKVKDALVVAGIEVTSADFDRKPLNTVELSGEDKEKVFNFLASLEALDDVQKVYSNIAV